MISEWYDKLLLGIEGSPLAAYVGSKYVLAIIVFLFFLALSAVFAFLLKALARPLAKRTKTKADDLIVEAVRGPMSKIIVLAGAGLALIFLELPQDVNSTLVNVIVSIVYLIIVLCAIRIANILFATWGKTWTRRTKSTIDDELLPLAHKTTNAAIVIIGFMLILTQWGIDVMPLLAGLGIAGLALGFAVKDSLSNIFGGISLVLDRTFKVGDKVKLESGEAGRIHDIGLRSTKLRTFDNEIITIPNGVLANMKIKNYVKPDKRIRVNVSFSVEYGSDIKKVEKVVLGAVKKMDGVMPDPPPKVLFKEMGESSLNFVAKFWIPDYNLEYAKMIEGTTIIYNALNRAKIGIPFPTRTIYMHK